MTNLFSRLESGEIYIEEKLFDIAELVKESEAKTIPIYNMHRVVFHPVEGTIAMADRARMGQVLSNFISNAVKYSKPGNTINVACVTEKDQAGSFPQFGTSIVGQCKKNNILKR